MMWHTQSNIHRKSVPLSEFPQYKLCISSYYNEIIHINGNAKNLEILDPE